MLFALLHRPPEFDYLGLTMNVNDLEESIAIKLKEKLDEQRERTAEVIRSKRKAGH